MSTEIAEYTKTEAALADLRTRFQAVVYDVASRQGMDEAKKARAEIRGYRVELEKIRVQIKAPALERCRAIDADAKRITAELEALENPIHEQIKSEEDRVQREKDAKAKAEADRVAAINARFDALKAMATVPSDFTAEQIKSRIVEVNELDGDGLPEELAPAWTHESRLVTASLRASLDRREVYEAEQVELAKLRAAAAEVESERLRLAEVERQRLADEVAAEKAKADIERAEQAARDAQEAAARAAEQAEIDRAEAVRQAEERATREAEARESKRRQEEAAAAEAQRVADEKRAANLANRKKINNAAVDAFMDDGFAEEHAKQIVTLIASGKIPNITINY